MNNDQFARTAKKILFCTDFSANANIAFAYAIEQAQFCRQSELHLLHVVPEPDAQFWNTYLYEAENVDSKAQLDMTQKIRDAYTSRLPDNLNMQVHIRAGIEYEQILELAEKEAIDLIVIGRQGHSRIGRILFGDVTSKIATHATCAVLIVPLTNDK